MLERLAVVPALAVLLGSACVVRAEPSINLPYTPSIWARHQWQILIDQQHIHAFSSQWPLPSNVVSDALSGVSAQSSESAQVSSRFVQSELRQIQHGQLTFGLVDQADKLVGFAEQATPGSYVEWVGKPAKLNFQEHSLTTRLGLRWEQPSNSLQSSSDPNSAQVDQVRLSHGYIGLMVGDWMLHAFSRPTWWGPGWQSSLLDGHNHPQWVGMGLQRAQTHAFEHRYLSWMGPWMLDAFVAQAQDPEVVIDQPTNFLYVGTRFAFKPQPWLEIGLSRGLQVMGKGRPDGVDTFLKSLLGQEVNEDPDSTFEDSSSQIAGYDVRASCITPWFGETCSGYLQLMGEDAQGDPPLPMKFMYQLGGDAVWGGGRYRLWFEHSNTYTHRGLGWGRLGVGYLNGHYPQGFTQGTRWIGSSQGGGSRVTTLGLMDAKTQTLWKLHWGEIGISLGSYVPSASAPHSKLRSLEWSRSFQHGKYVLTPSIGLCSFKPW